MQAVLSVQAARAVVVPSCSFVRASPASRVGLCSFPQELQQQKALLTQARIPPLSSRPNRPGDLRLVTRAQADSQKEDPEDEKIPFGYTRKDVIFIGVALTALGFGIRYGLEYIFGFDPLQAGSVTQLVVVLGLCFGWVSTYLWRVGNKEMTYAKQLRDYESAVMQKRLEALSETDLEAMLAEVEEEKQRLRKKREKTVSKE